MYYPRTLILFIILILLFPPNVSIVAEIATLTLHKPSENVRSGPGHFWSSPGHRKRVPSRLHLKVLSFPIQKCLRQQCIATSSTFGYASRNSLFDQLLTANSTLFRRSSCNRRL